MDVTAYIAALKKEGAALAAAAELAGPTAQVPTCPGWQVEDLLRHIGYVHRWACRFVTDGLEQAATKHTEHEVLRLGPPRESLVDWYREGLDNLARALGRAAPDLQCWTFLAAPSPLLFWARRQGHETAIHRVDAQVAAGVTPAAFDPEFASDGIEELLFGFLSRRKPETANLEPLVVLTATDAVESWRLARAGRAFVTSRSSDAAPCQVQGAAADLYLTLWNRPTAGPLRSQGDSSWLDWWREVVQVTWK